MVHQTPEYTNGPAKRGIEVKEAPKGSSRILNRYSSRESSEIYSPNGKISHIPFKVSD